MVISCTPLITSGALGTEGKYWAYGAGCLKRLIPAPSLRQVGLSPLMYGDIGKAMKAATNGGGGGGREGHSQPKKSMQLGNGNIVRVPGFLFIVLTFFMKCAIYGLSFNQAFSLTEIYSTSF